MHIYLIKYLTTARGECLDSETANNQVIAIRNFKERRPNAFAIRIKNRQGVWIDHV